MLDDLNCTALRAYCDRFSGPLGPFRTLDDYDREMREAAHALAAGGRDALAACFAKLAREGYDEIDTAEEFAGVCLREIDGFAAPLLAQVGPDGPVLIVEVLGGARETGIAARLLEVIDIAAAPSDLQVALISTLGAIADDRAREALRTLDISSLSSDARSELDIALESLRRS